jgi:NAD(P)-dependent dehydrogenase (short-subunit alcohol dehydrogenase family)
MKGALTMPDRTETQPKAELEDPREAGARPPFPDTPQEPQGSEVEMDPKPDHGETSYRGSGRLEGRRAVITGGDSGIGRAVAIAFAREGADILIAYLSHDDDATETARWVEKAGRKAVLVPGDITDEAHCERLIARAVDELGGIDILVNNAAFQRTHEDISEFSSEEFDRTMKTNVYAMFYLCKAAVARMEPGSAIVNVASIQAYQPSPYLLAYATTKGAIVNFTQGLGQLLGEKGIRVNAVAPGPVWTPLIPSTMPPDKVKEFGKDTPLGRPAQPAELAPIFVFLASNEASYVTAAVYAATGGKPTA